MIVATKGYINYNNKKVYLLPVTVLPPMSTSKANCARNYLYTSLHQLTVAIYLFSAICVKIIRHMEWGAPWSESLDQRNSWLKNITVKHIFTTHLKKYDSLLSEQSQNISHYDILWLTESIKSFLTEFYRDGEDGGKDFKYGQQLVRTKLFWCNSIWNGYLRFLLT